jgi:hypothetical protein
MSRGCDYGLEPFAHTYHDQVFRLDELKQVIDTYGLPRPELPATYEGHQHRAFEHYIEIQLWSDTPIGTAVLS